MVHLAWFYSVLFSVYGFYGNRLNIDLDSLSFFFNMQLFHIERASDFIIHPILFHSSATSTAYVFLLYAIRTIKFMRKK